MKERESVDVDGGKTTLPQESVWDYPRPPRIEATERLLRVVHRGIVIAETRRGMRILETSHPPVYYIPTADVMMRLVRPSARRGSFCEFKGVASYWDLDLTAEGGTVVPGVGCSYAAPSKAYAGLRDYLAFYASKVNECWVDQERVVAQAGDFYGGWITANLKGPFKGAPGTLGW